MADLTAIEKYFRLADLLIAQSTKQNLADCTRLLALNLAHHQIKHGEMPLDETLATVDAAEPNEEQLKLLVQGMEILVGVLGNVLSGLGEMKH